MPNYSNGKIYKIWSPSHPELGHYIGSTTRRLSQRLSEHKSDAKIGRNCTSKVFFEFNDARIDLLEEYPCKGKEHLNSREGEWVLKGGCVNQIVEGRTKKAYYEQNKEKIKNRNKEYYKQHKDKKKELHKRYRKHNEDKIKKFHKRYREQNSEMMKERQKIYYEQNKEKIKEYQKRRITCPICSKPVQKVKISRHKKTKKCLHHSITAANHVGDSLG